jgi:diguanylate cyclase (GGDEF)-like protein
LITLEDALRLKEQLLDLLEEDTSNQEVILNRPDGIRTESGVAAHSALLLILTGQSFEENEARAHWEAILRHREGMGQRIGRDVGLRVAAFDYFININRRVRQPRLIELNIADPIEPSSVSDPLTGLPNERMFRMTLQREVRRARRYGPGFAISLMDIDDIDEANRRFGTLVVDSLVRECAIVIGNNVRDTDMAARTSGGHFGLILPETDRMGGYMVCERIRREIESFFRDRKAADRTTDLTVSAGLAKYPDDGSGPEELIARARETLYVAKSRGKNNVAVYFAERRHFLRFDVHGRGLQIRAIPDPSPPEEESNTSPTNISRGGLLFETDRAHQLGEQVLLDLCEADGTQAIRVRARVVRIEELHPSAAAGGSARFEVGVVFHFDWEHEEQDFLSFFERWSRVGLGS